MKKKSLSRNKGLLREKYVKRRKFIWECVRRNKDYIRDFALFKEGKLNDLQKRQLAMKWHIGGVYERVEGRDEKEVTAEMKWRIRDSFADPKEPTSNISEKEWDSSPFYPEPGVPQIWPLYFTDKNPKKEFDFFDVSSKREIYIFRPGAGVGFPKDGKRIEDWEIADQNEKFEKLTKKNCPHWISIWIEVQPWFSKSAIEKNLMASFEEAYELVKDAQEVVLKKKTLGPRDDDEFQKFMMAFDYKDKNPGITLNDIAVRMFPNDTDENRKRTRKLAKPWAKEKVRYYLERADYYINKQGWKEL